MALLPSRVQELVKSYKCVRAANKRSTALCFQLRSPDRLASIQDSVWANKEHLAKTLSDSTSGSERFSFYIVIWRLVACKASTILEDRHLFLTNAIKSVTSNFDSMRSLPRGSTLVIELTSFTGSLRVIASACELCCLVKKSLSGTKLATTPVAFLRCVHLGLALPFVTPCSGSRKVLVDEEEGNEDDEERKGEDGREEESIGEEDSINASPPVTIAARTIAVRIAASPDPRKFEPPLSFLPYPQSTARVLKTNSVHIPYFLSPHLLVNTAPRKAGPTSYPVVVRRDGSAGPAIMARVPGPGSGPGSLQIQPGAEHWTLKAAAVTYYGLFLFFCHGVAKTGSSMSRPAARPRPRGSERLTHRVRSRVKCGDEGSTVTMLSFEPGELSTPTHPFGQDEGLKLPVVTGGYRTVAIRPEGV
eukprot:766570-Hanusia_phi.AAC.4